MAVCMSTLLCAFDVYFKQQKKQLISFNKIERNDKKKYELLIELKKIKKPVQYANTIL